MTRSFSPAGIIPACLLPFQDDLAVDHGSLRRHLRDLADVKGVSAIVVNGHASEVSSCTLEEQRLVLTSALEEVGDELALVSGIFASSTIEAGKIARMAEAAGASALLVFPPSPFELGYRREMVFEYFSSIADASSLPLVIFQYPAATRQSYDLETLLSLCDRIPSIRAVKDWVGEPQLHERQLRALAKDFPRVAVLTAHSAWLLSSLVLGCQGILSGAGSVIAALQAELFSSLKNDDLPKARETADRIFPLTEVFYSHPWVDMHNRMKEALVLLGRQPNAVVRPPLIKLGQNEIERIKKALISAKLLRSDGKRW